MKPITPLFIVLSLVAVFPAFAKENYWECVAKDVLDKSWLGFSSFEKVAKQKALDNCKKESVAPRTCKTSSNQCVSPYDHTPASAKGAEGGSSGPAWQCTALDRNGEPWIGTRSESRDDAALNARAYCVSKSNIPKTCYVNTVTCEKRGAR